MNIETLTGNGFSYDFTGNPDVAAINYDIDVTDPNNYQILDNENYLHPIVDRTNQTVRLDLDWDLKAASIISSSVRSTTTARWTARTGDKI